MNRQQHRACEAIEQANYDFTAKLYATHDLYDIASRDSLAIRPRVIKALRGLLLSSTFKGQRQCLFLYREAAGVLTTIIRFGRQLPVAVSARQALDDVLRLGRNQAQRAAAEALGSLPLSIQGPPLPPLECGVAPGAAWEHLVSQLPDSRVFAPRRIGRSIVATLQGDRMVVVKMARSSSDRQALLDEVQWMRYLAEHPLSSGVRFEVPEPIMVNGSPLFRLLRFPRTLTAGPCLPRKPLSVCFTVSKSYFDYPNPAVSAGLPAPCSFVEVMGRSAHLLGELTGHGIVHTSPIPLFHNRVQQDRRRDGGVYEWYRAGRLDRWLDSCAYPNFGFSGLRDFEHFQSFSGHPGTLYRYIGNHLLSLMLVAASYFRAKDPNCRGWSADGRPADARGLFDRELLQKVLTIIYRHYYEGFVGQTSHDTMPVKLNGLVSRIIDELGVDRHMEEFLRAADQHQMSRSAFERFLLERGYSAEAVSGLEKGAGDLAILTGPHLGSFNRGISIPELIEATAAMSATCILERFMRSDS